ncbi:MAG: tetratricopeptide repeat protein, partial [Nitrosopumilus sp.]|nr:tetratricopeptide repeat protein [Nitrosopumilus sp.]
LRNMGRYQDALDSHNRALEIDTQLGDIIGLAYDHNNIGLVLKNMNRIDEAEISYNKGLDILKEFEKNTGYHHPFYETLKRNLDDCT